MAGRKPKPTALKKLEGNPGKRKLNMKEPVPAKGVPDCPKWLLPEAKADGRDVTGSSEKIEADDGNKDDDGNKENSELRKCRILPGAQCRGRG